MPDIPPPTPEIADVFAGFAAPVGDRLRTVRALVFETADRLPEIGRIEESLKWGQPSYATVAPVTGTPVRLGPVPGRPGDAGLFVHCGTSLVAQYRTLYGDLFDFDGNRGVLFDARRPLPRDALKHCIALALTYRLRRG